MILASFVALSIAAVPPLSSADRQEEAELIAVGTVTSIESKDVKVEDGTDHEYTATIRVDEIAKGIVPTPTATPATSARAKRSKKKPAAKAEEIAVHFRRTGTRPPGWAGPAGQNALFQKGDRIRVFARTIDGGWRLLEPNGWEPAPHDTRRE